VAAFLALVTTFPVVIYTVLLGAAIIYWLFVMVGAIHLDSGDGAADGLLDGADGGHHVDAGDAGGDTGGDADAGGDHGDVGDAPGGLAGMMAALKLRSVPVTIVFSLLALFSWIFSIIGVEIGMTSTVLRVLALVVAPILALFPTSVMVLPFANLFLVVKAVKSKDLVGKLCTIRTGTVTDRFGEATLEDGGAGVVVRVRVESGEKLMRGQQAVIVGYDDERHEFTVAPMDVLEEERRQKG
jgi:hypothetical protein